MMYLIYFSPTYTTKKVLEAVAKGCNQPYEHIDLTLKSHRNKSLFFEKDDVVLIGMPVYAGRIPKLMAEYLASMTGGGAKVVPIVVYGNREYDDALLELNNMCLEKGFQTVAAAAFIGEHSYTSIVATQRPDEQDLLKAYEFGKKIVWQSKELFLKGHFPYREYVMSLPIAPLTTESCNDCGVCAKQCPLEAIDQNDVSITNEHLCIKCFRCVKNCHQHAKYFDERLNGVKQWLIDNFTNRKEPEVFEQTLVK